MMYKMCWKSEDSVIARYWPARLVHIPTFYSYPRSQGHKYRPEKSGTEPCYSTISYSWGRYVVSAGRDEILKGVPWPLPPIDPSHFTSQQLQIVLRAAAAEAQVDYLWIDIACIDQTGDPAGTEEVHKQAEIFKFATEGFIWLSRTSEQLIEQILHGIQEVLKSRVLEMEVTNFSANTLYPVLQLFEDLIADPWFSSLWTLQEAFSNPSAILIGKECRIIRWSKSYNLLQSVISPGYDPVLGNRESSSATKGTEERQSEESTPFRLRHLVLCARKVANKFKRVFQTITGEGAALKNQIQILEQMRHCGLLSFDI